MIKFLRMNKRLEKYVENRNNPKVFKVCFVFASVGIGGAERSMLRMMEYSHPNIFDCSVIIYGAENPTMTESLEEIGIAPIKIKINDISRIIDVIRELRPDAMYLFGTVRLFVFGLIAKLVGVRLIVGAERSSLDRSIEKFFRRIDKLFINIYISNSKYSADILNNY